MRPNKLLREPLFFFFIAGALLFIVQRVVAGAPHTITVTRAVRTDLARRYQDTYGRPPTAAELRDLVHQWETDEALFREAERAHLDRDDPGVRSILVDKMRLRASFEVPQHEPTDAELDAFLASHRDRYQMPRRFDFEFVAFPKSDPHAREQLDAFERALAAGKPPATLGRPVIGGDLAAADMKGRMDARLAARLPQLPPGGPWQRVETAQSFFLARVKAVDSGMPTRQALGERLVEDWKRITRQEAADRILQRTIARYHFVEEP